MKEKNSKALSITSQVLQNTAFNLAILFSMYSVIAKNPSYGKVRLFFCYVGIGIAFLCADLILRCSVKSACNINEKEKKSGKSLADFAGYKSPRLHWVCNAFTTIAFCIAVEALAKFDKIDNDFASRFIWSIATIAGTLSIIAIPNAFISSQTFKKICESLDDAKYSCDDSCISVIAASHKMGQSIQH